jgi:hypothetical protein
MKRHWLVAVATLASLPAFGSAQMRSGMDDGWGPKIRATPFVGWSPGFNSSGNLAVLTSGTVQTAQYSFDYAGGPVTGVNLEVRAHERFSGVVSAAWSSRGRITFLDDDGFEFEEAGSDFVIAKVAGQMRFREDSEMQLRRLNAAVFLGPAFFLELPETSALSGIDADARTHFGVNFGAEGELPLANKKFALYGALEDYVIFWNEGSMAERFGANLGSGAEVDADHSNMWVIRLGLSVRFR